MFGMIRNYIEIKETLLKYDMYYIFCAISDVYGNESLNKFVSYVKKMYDLDTSYTWGDIIEVMDEDEIIMNISVFFDSEDERHISEIGIKDLYLEKLILCLKRNVPYKSKPTYNDALKAAKEYVDIYGQPSSSYPIYIYSPLYNRYDYALTYTKSSPTTTLAAATPQSVIITPLLTAQLYYNNYVIKTYSLYSQNSNNTDISVTKYTNGNYNYLCKLNATKNNFSISHKRITNVKLGGINITNYKIAGSIINIGLPKNYHGKTLYVYLEDGNDNGSSTTSSSTQTTTSPASTVSTSKPSATSSNT